MTPVPPSPSPPPIDLTGLHDIVAPAPASWVPQTVGWYVLLALLVALAAWAVWWYRQWREANRYRREALAELEDIVHELERKGGRHHLAFRLPELLKRVALHVEPRESVASLVGDDWLHMLDRMYAGDAFTKGPGRLLPRLAYGTPAYISNVQRAEIDALVRLSRDWIGKHHRVPSALTAKPRTGSTAGGIGV